LKITGLTQSSACIVAQTLSDNANKTFAHSLKQTAIPAQNLLNLPDSVLVSADNYRLVPVLKYLEEEALKPNTGNGDIEIEILTECNGPLAQLLRNSGSKFLRITQQCNSM